MNSTSKKFTDWQLEQYVLNELDQDTNDLIELQVQSDDQLLDRINLIKQSNAEILIKMPAKAFMQKNKIEAIQVKENHKKLNWFNKLIQLIQNPAIGSGVIASMALALVILVLPQQYNLNDSIDSSLQSDESGIRLKGLQPVLKVYKKTGLQLSILDKLQAGDVLQLSYIAGTANYGYIISLDGNGVLTEHLVDNLKAVKLNKEGENALEFAYQLDDAPDFERFIFITSDQSFDTQLIISAINELVISGQGKYAQVIIENTNQKFSVESITLNKKQAGEVK